jgi:IS5 family transposase
MARPRARLAYPPLTMFKIVLLQQWYTLSDPAAEEAERDTLERRKIMDGVLWRSDIPAIRSRPGR